MAPTAHLGRLSGGYVNDCGPRAPARSPYCRSDGKM